MPRSGLRFVGDAVSNRTWMRPARHGVREPAAPSLIFCECCFDLKASGRFFVLLHPIIPVIMATSVDATGSPVSKAATGAALIEGASRSEFCTLTPALCII